jgi:pilus assembly protein CpaB
MNRRLLTVLGFAFLVALGATVLLYTLIADRIRGATSAPVNQPLVVAARDLPRGVLLKENDVKTINWSSTTLPKGAFTNPQEVINRGVVLETSEGEPITEQRLAPKQAGAGLAPAIPLGKRAVALRVNEVVAVSGYVIPGSRVDVLITGNAPGQGQEGPEIKTVLQNIEVLSAGTTIQRDAEGKPLQVPVITVLVSPEEAETLSLAANETRIQLVLRNPLDDKNSEPPGTAVARLFRGGKGPPATPVVRRKAEVKKVAAPPPAPPPPPPPIVVELLKGTSRKQEKFEAAAPAEKN